MEAILERCCGIDVHKKIITACLMVGKPHEKPKKTIKTFTTMTRDLLACKDWLESQGCTHVALESTGVYWKPVFNILEESIEVILANARDIKNVPGWIPDDFIEGIVFHPGNKGDALSRPSAKQGLKI